MLPDSGPQLRKGVVEYCVLGLLSKEAMYGWQLSEVLVAHGMIASVGTLYPLLGRLRSQGLITSYEQDSPSGPVRKFYEVTERGAMTLEAFKGQWEPFVEAVDRLVVKGTSNG